ncbi:exosortase/archaeosortase family protein [Stieleria magnilauensis]|uniref:Transmembrane exosortase (Exosortase_EpsH) n=1 Tax=Stieleria magnilauensis TaxID=2527963 RepID=A0ABX5XLS0_9BACT|nr:Transmembrane exosortase (Exosortase_EpsH) [Planctomycetes bacterium TBK1r]
MSKKRKPIRPPAKNGGGKTRSRSKSAGLTEMNRKLARGESVSLAPQKAEAEPLVEVAPPRRWSASTWGMLALAIGILAYSYLPTFSWIVDSWQNEPDYGHGWFVVPLALYLCYRRSHLFPGASEKVAWQGLSLVFLAIGIRVLSRFAYADFLDAYSILPALAGAVWCLLGLRAMLWALPAIGFLFFAIPLPFQAESALSWNLQGVATDLSTFFLRALGQPAVAEGHIVWMGEEKLMIEEACSGLRIFVGMAACAYFWAVLSDRNWSDRAVLVMAAIPAAILVNAARIVVIGLFYTQVSSAAGRHWIHDFSGYAMIAASFALLGLVSWYWQLVYKRVPIMTAKETLRGSVSHS